MAHKFVREFKPGDLIDQVLLVTKKELRNRAGGAPPYGHLELRDKSNRIEGKIWDNAAILLETFEEGDFTQIRAQVGVYKNRLELIISSIAPVDPKQLDLTDFIPHTRKDIELLTEQLKELLEPVKEPYLARLIQAFLQDASFIASFQKVPASVSHHQAYIGGLLEHTINILKLGRLILPEYPMLNRDLFLTGAFLHDIGKVREYVIKHQFDKTLEGRLIGHIALGLGMVEERINTLKGFPETLALQLRHLILSHHGELELGAPILPMTLEAIILHYLDNLDAKVNVRLMALEELTDPNAIWAELWEDGARHRIYKGKSSGSTLE